MNSQQNGNVDLLTGQEYLSQVTTFYGIVITLLLGVVGILLAVSFVYVHTTSEARTRNIISESLESHFFINEVDRKILSHVEDKAKSVFNDYLEKNLSDVEVTQEAVRMVNKKIDQAIEDLFSRENITSRKDIELRLKTLEAVSDIFGNAGRDGGGNITDNTGEGSDGNVTDS